MKQKQLAGLAVFVVGVMGGSAFGDHHLEVCSHHAWWCQGECAELNACRSGNTPIGGLDCLTEEFNLFRCEADGPPGIPIVIVPPPPPPPSACPAGQHFSGGACQADHECGDDEIGGGSEECEPCGAGQVPNQDGTACRSCPHGESDTSSGLCAADPCGVDAVDDVAIDDLGQIPKEPRERGRFFYCLEDEIRKTEWSFSTGDACYVTIRRKYGHEQSCWPASSRPSSGCNLAAIHTHPYFTKADSGVVCGGVTIDERSARELNDEGMSFGGDDLAYSIFNNVDAYLGVPDRSCVKGNRVASRGYPTVVAGECTPTPLPHTPWSELP